MRGTLPPAWSALLQRRVRRRLRRDLRAGGGPRLQLRGGEDLRRRRAPAAAARARRRQGRTVRRAGREALRRDLAEAPGAARAGPEPGAAAARRSRTRWNPPARSRRRWKWCRCAWPASSRAVEQLRAMPIRGAARAPAAPGRHRRGQARLRRSAAGEGAPRRQGSDRARRLDGQGRRHHPPGPALSAPPAASTTAAGWHPPGAGAGPAAGGVAPRSTSSCGAGRGGGDRAGGELHQPGLHKRRRSVARWSSTCAPAWWWASRSRWCWP